jgi:limonene-1,2-epoxide hydrolase
MDRTIPVRNVIAAWAAGDLDLMMEQLADDAVFENVPMDPIVGKEAIRAANGAQLALCDGAPWKVLNIAVCEDTATVLTERLDAFVLKDGRTVYAPTMGAWTVNDANKITRWRDYFDLASWNRQMGADPDFAKGDGGLQAIIEQ